MFIFFPSAYPTNDDLPYGCVLCRIFHQPRTGEFLVFDKMVICLKATIQVMVGPFFIICEIFHPLQQELVYFDNIWLTLTQQYRW